jgi:hypothetical protein
MILPSNYRRTNNRIIWKALVPYIQYKLQNGVSCYKIAEEIGCTIGTLSGAMCYLRAKGEDVPDMRMQNNNVATKLHKGILYKRVKVNGKWKQIGRVEGQAYKDRSEYKAPGGRKRLPSELTTVSTLRKQNNMPRPREPKKEVPKMQTRVVDTSTMKMVRVSKTMHIQVSLDVPDEVAIEMWKKKYEQ